MTTEEPGATDGLDCDAARERLHDLLKEELTPEVAARVRAHLERCAPCFTQLRYAERFHEALRTPASGTRCPEPLRHRIGEALRAELGGP